jgi:hypothetical protein
MTSVASVPFRELQLTVKVAQWRRERCVACAIGSSCPKFLLREFENWSGLRCAMDQLITVLGKLGFCLDRDRMIGGLIVIEDFKAGRQYERQRCV